VFTSKTFFLSGVVDVDDDNASVVVETEALEELAPNLRTPGGACFLNDN